MNKNLIYIGIAVLFGLFIGWLLFGSTTENQISNKDAVHNHAGETADQMWTCSMHPQIMQAEKGDCPICGMDLIPVESNGEGLALNEIKMSKNAMALANVRTTIVGNSNVDSDDMISLSGKIKMNEEENTIQASYFDGRIEKLNVNFEGQKLQKGQLLATIYAPALVAAQQELITAASLKKSQPTLYKAVRNKLKLWKLSESQINTIETSGKVRENFPIYTTVSGTVSEKMASEGDYVKQGQALVKVSNLNSVWADFDAYENQIPQFKTGQKITIVTNAYPDKEFDATVSFIDPVLNTQTRTVTVRTTLNNKEGIFKPGMFVKAKIKSKSDGASEQLTIPASSVMWTGERSVVYIKTDPNEPVFEMREVGLGKRFGDTFSVVSGLQNGEEIVTNGTFTVDAAAQLQGKTSMMNPGNSAADKSGIMRDMNLKFSQAFQKKFEEALPLYMKLKDAFVASDTKQVSTWAKAASKKLKTIDSGTLPKMENSHFSKSIQMLEAIVEDDNIENQRAHFVLLNANIAVIAMNMKNTELQLFVQKCPMANNDKGAIWLSMEKEIKNPYYGEDMLSCGSVINRISD